MRSSCSNVTIGGSRPAEEVGRNDPRAVKGRSELLDTITNELNAMS
jgi:hypothetical protein